MWASLRAMVSDTNTRWVVLCRMGNLAVMIGLVVYFLVWPLVVIPIHLSDSALKDRHIPRLAFRVHRSLTPKYEKWARDRVASGQAACLDVENVPATEWPVFGSVFFLLATEALQEAWEQSPSGPAPAVYARQAIVAATELVLDKGHTTWVRHHWGDNYLHKENCFYRMLLIHAVVCYQDLLVDARHEPLLRDQVESLVREIDASPHGLLDDYPGQCFPSDVMAALAAIQRADRLLGTDHGEFLTRARRGFQGGLVDDRTGLPPYMADSKGGHATEARGSTSQWACAWAPLVWPDKAKEWYRAFETHFWQRRWGSVGLREFTRGQEKHEWTFDVDAGPVLGGFAVATTAFGIGAARVNGRFDHAYPLSAETIALSWPLPDGTLLLPRILSRGLGAPYIGEAAVLYNLTRQPPEGMPPVYGGTLPAVVFGVLGLLLVRVMMDVRSVWRRWHQAKTWIGQRTFLWPRAQWGLWLILTLSGLWVFFSVDLIVGLLILCASQLLPLGRRIPGQDQATPCRP